MVVIPHTFDEWKDCIVNDCNINLTKAFAEERLVVYRNPKHPETRKFKSLYGEQHLNNVIYWYEKIAG
ncbi:MAG: hypothetical protein AAF741_09825 [Bacteroidota bacterium]